MSRSLVVIPTYNEVKNVLRISEAVLAQSPDVQVLVVDDNSPDGTADAVKGMMEGENRLHLKRREKKLGLGTAYIAGFRYGLEKGFDHILTMDCDFSHKPEQLPGLLGKQDVSDMVIGSRYIPGGGIANWPLHRRMLSSFANAYTRTLLRLPIRDCTSGYRSYSRKVLETIDLDSFRSSGYSFLEEMVFRVYRLGFRIAEVPILFEDRLRGTSKIDRSEIFRAAWHVLRTAFHPPKDRR